MSAFQELRRWQEADPDGRVRCISCGKLLDAGEAQGGHFVSRRIRATELEPDNVWPQCRQCNGPYGGNQAAYRSNLVALIGGDRVRRIEDMANASCGSEEACRRLGDADKRAVVRRRTDAEYDALAASYRTGVRELKKEKGK